MGKKNKRNKITEEIRPGIESSDDINVHDLLDPRNKDPRPAYLKLLGFSLVIAACTFFTFYPMLENEFTNWDDTIYLTENSDVRSISWSNIKEIFHPENKIMGVYTPLTILSYALDYHLYELNPKPYFRGNLFIHVFNTVLVFLLIYLLCNSLIIASFTALAFGIHPMHVESVAWITERKDVLFSFFFLAGLICYRHYIILNKLKPLYYFLAFLLFVLSVLAKPQAVAFPLVMVCIDILLTRKDYRTILIDKLPFLIVSLLVGVFTLRGLNPSSALNAEALGLSSGVAFSYVAIGQYLQNIFLPLKLSCYYPFPGSYSDINLIDFLMPLLGLSLYSVILFKVAHKRHIIFGGLFFIFNLVLVLHLLTINTSLAYDRFSYLPYIGIFYILGYGIYLGQTRLPRFRILFIILPIGFLVGMGVQTWNRTMVWKDSNTLWTNAIENYPSAALPFNGRGKAYYDKKNFNAALLDLTEAIKINPTYPEALNNRGLVFYETNYFEDALSDFDLAIQVKPYFAEAINNRGIIHNSMGNTNLSLIDFTRAIKLDENYVSAYNNRGNIYNFKGEYEKALADFNFSLTLDPLNAETYNNRGIAYYFKKEYNLAYADYDKAISLNSNYAEAYSNRGLVKYKQGQKQEALDDFNSAIRSDPNYAAAYYNRSMIFYENSNFTLALESAERAKVLGYDIPDEFIEALKIKVTEAD
ncbi:MAG: tetratricopeptide repeat protein [Bacteroidetes bacterium]|nr:tetratricopeptide repeat protein [Bacteroidota bacterium]